MWRQEKTGITSKTWVSCCTGLDSSNAPITEAVNKGVDAKQGTADELPFPNNSFDIVVFDFCLYLCDRLDLFKITAEADRVLNKPVICLFWISTRRMIPRMITIILPLLKAIR
jgi:ubiquinone/menaquinone biosynthesis C-methylase UbiE